MNSLQYTIGNRFVTIEGDRYNGYFIYKNGRYYSYPDGYLLVEINNFDSSINDVNDLVKRSVNNIKYSYSGSYIEFPSNMSVIPSPSDYQAGIYTRYFVQYKFNPVVQNIFEVTKDWYSEKISDTEYTKNFYFFNMSWKLIGPRRDIIKNGVLVEEGVYDHNLRNIQKIASKIKDFINFNLNPYQFSYYQ
ncbi:MAG: hypothetical protein IRZ03_17480 [Acidobacterium ailaaui]|nr:hypothetical protein [Pseudacidobacterium ailaaui]